MLIEIKDIKKIYGSGEGSVKALKGVTCEIKKNDFVAVCGPSGSGKSTLLTIMAGMNHPSNGEVVVDEISLYKMLNNDGMAEFRKEYIGFVFQSFQLINYLTVIQNVMLPLVTEAISKREKKEKAVKILSQLDINDKINAMPEELSGGQKQRVALARAMVNEPPIIIADEPTGNLDSETRDDILLLFEDIRKKGHTIIMVTHDIENIKYANKIINIKDGLIELVE